MLQESEGCVACGAYKIPVLGLCDFVDTVDRTYLILVCSSSRSSGGSSSSSSHRMLYGTRKTQEPEHFPDYNLEAQGMWFRGLGFIGFRV